MSQKCRWCDRKVIFRAGGKKGKKTLHSAKDHDLCSRCFRDLENKVKHGHKRKDHETVTVLSRQVGPFLPLQVLLQQQLMQQQAQHDHAVDILDRVFGPEHHPWHASA